MLSMLSFLRGWTALIIIVVLIAVGQVLGGTFRKIAWVLAVVAALVTVYNELRGHK